MLVLENWDHAQARGIPILGEIVGFGMSSDAHHITQPCVDGPAKSMQWALRDAGLTPERIGYINAHGTGTQANDLIESQAIRLIFGAEPTACRSVRRNPCTATHWAPPAPSRPSRLC